MILFFLEKAMVSMVFKGRILLWAEAAEAVVPTTVHIIRAAIHIMQAAIHIMRAARLIIHLVHLHTVPAVRVIRAALPAAAAVADAFQLSSRLLSWPLLRAASISA